jgi:hypothetical protein
LRWAAAASGEGGLGRRHALAPPTDTHQALAAALSKLCDPSLPSQANDVYAVINAVPAIALCTYGFLNPSIPGALCFGAGLGITLFGWAYLFTHDGLVHKRWAGTGTFLLPLHG